MNHDLTLTYEVDIQNKYELIQIWDLNMAEDFPIADICEILAYPSIYNFETFHYQSPIQLNDENTIFSSFISPPSKLIQKKQNQQTINKLPIIHPPKPVHQSLNNKTSDRPYLIGDSQAKFAQQRSSSSIEGYGDERKNANNNYNVLQ